MADSSYVAGRRLAETENQSFEGADVQPGQVSEKPTERMARELLMQLAALEKSGEDPSKLSPQAKASLMAIVSDVGRTIELASYRPEGLKAAATDSPTHWQLYASQLIDIFYKFKKSKINDAEILSKVFVADNEELADLSQLAELKQASAYYSRLVETLKAMEVPPGAMAIHIDLLNGYSRLASSLQIIVQMEQDPLTGVVGMAQYSAASELISLASKALVSGLDSRGVKELPAPG
jgi:hypothetical protein